MADPAELKKAVIENWDKYVRHAITEKQEVALEGKFLDYVQAFDFSIFDAKSSLQIIEDHRSTCPCHAARFGGGLPQRPAPEQPPDIPAAKESRYVAQLLEAYADHKNSPWPMPWRSTMAATARTFRPAT